jgi:gamma-glutamyltranspeptidase/glutathione hydrolase
MAQIAREVISKDFAGTLRSRIGETATPAQQVIAREGTHTTHVSAIDEEGNAVALTTSVNDLFGSCVAAKGAGFLLNDTMDDFATAPDVPNAYGLRGGSENAPGPGKVPLSTMAPTLVFAPDGELRLVLGAAGGPTIATTIAQAIVHVVDDKMPVDQAIAAPRIHHNLFPDAIWVEPNGLDAATAKALAARGHRLAFRDSPWGKAEAVEIDLETGWREGATDPRFEGTPAVP